MSLNIRWALVVTSAFVGAILISETAAAAEPEPAASVASTVADQPATTSPNRLDLRAPDVTRLFTQEQIHRILAATFRENIEEVQVEGERDISATPRVWPGIFAPFWAVANPTQAWRIIAPLPPDRTRSMHLARASTTDSYLLEPAGVFEPDYLR